MRSTTLAIVLTVGATGGAGFWLGHDSEPLMVCQAGDVYGYRQGDDLLFVPCGEAFNAKTHPTWSLRSWPHGQYLSVPQADGSMAKMRPRSSWGPLGFQRPRSWRDEQHDYRSCWDDGQMLRCPEDPPADLEHPWSDMIYLHPSEGFRGNGAEILKPSQEVPPSQAERRLML